MLPGLTKCYVHGSFCLYETLTIQGLQSACHLPATACNLWCTSLIGSLNVREGVPQPLCDKAALRIEELLPRCGRHRKMHAAQGTRSHSAQSWPLAAIAQPWLLSGRRESMSRRGPSFNTSLHAILDAFHHHSCWHIMGRCKQMQH